MYFCVERDEFIASENVWMRRVTEPMAESDAFKYAKACAVDPVMRNRNVVMREVPKGAVHHAI